MSGYDPVSRQAFERVDVTAQQARVLSAFTPGAQHTRQELVQLTGMPINAICGRCKELLDAGTLESLPAVKGRHPLRLKNAAQEMAPPARRAVDDSLSFNASPVAASLIAVIPYTGYQQPMSRDVALRIAENDKSNAFYRDALKVLGRV